MKWKRTVVKTPAGRLTVYSRGDLEVSDNCRGKDGWHWELDRVSARGREHLGTFATARAAQRAAR